MRRLSRLFSASSARIVLVHAELIAHNVRKECGEWQLIIHELAGWPKFRWNGESLAGQLAAVRHRQGRLIGRMEGLGLKLRAEATLRTLTEEVVKSSEIEGEILNKDQVRSSLARRLGIEIGALTPADRNVEGIVEMILDATEKYDEPLTAERLFGWHAALFPTGRSGMRKITVGNWRTEDAGLCRSSPVPSGANMCITKRPPPRSSMER